MNDLFNPKGAENSPVKTNSELYKVNYKEGKGNVYTSVVRFIPWVTDPSKCIIEKQVSYVKNPVTKQAMYIDDPRSIGEFSPVTDMFFKFYNTKNDTFVKYGKENLSSKLQYASLVQIIKDDQHPELVGQIKVFIYGKKLWQKLYDEEHPPVGTGVNPFHPINGKFFLIHCCEQSGFNNYDQSKFFDNGGNNGMFIPVGDRMEQITENTDQNLIVEYLRTVSPDLGKYSYQPWTQEQAKFIEDCLLMATNYLNTGTLPTNMAVANGGANMQTVTQPVFPGATMQQPMQPVTNPMMPVNAVQPAAPMSGFNLGGMPVGGVQQNPGTVTEPSVSGINLPPTIGMQPTNSAPVNGGSIGGNIDDILKNI